MNYPRGNMVHGNTLGKIPSLQVGDNMLVLNLMS